MNKTVLIVVAIVILLLLGGGAYVAMSKKTSPGDSNNANPQTGVNTYAQPTSSSVQKSLKDLLLAGATEKCTYTDKLSSADISGTTYVSGGKVRTDYTTTTSETTVAGHMIVDGTTSYVWTDGQQTGFMMKFDPGKTAPTGGAGERQQSVDPNKTMNYNCTVWALDNSVFTPPTEVKFTDYSSIMIPPKGNGNTTTPSASDNSQACSACNYLSGDQKTQCLTSLKCN